MPKIPGEGSRAKGLSFHRAGPHAGPPRRGGSAAHSGLEFIKARSSNHTSRNGKTIVTRNTYSEQDTLLRTRLHYPRYKYYS